MINPMNEAALGYWRANGYSFRDILEFCRSLNKKITLGSVVFRGAQGICITISQKVADSKEGHAPAWIKYFKAVADNWKGAPLRGGFVLWADDGVWSWYRSHSLKAPVLAWNKKVQDNCTMMIPDGLFMHSLGYKEDLAKLDEFERDYPWEKKIRSVFWRGANTALSMASKDDAWRSTPRIKLAVLSKEINDPTILDAGISKVVDLAGNPEHVTRVQDLGIVKGACPLIEFFRYRYQIDVDGLYSSWGSTFMKLASKSLLLKVESDSRQWYYHKLKPWLHYVPVEEDVSDLREKIDWVFAHEQHCKEIAERATEMILAVTYKDSLQETGELLCELFKCQTDLDALDSFQSECESQ